MIKVRSKWQMWTKQATEAQQNKPTTLEFNILNNARKTKHLLSPKSCFLSLYNLVMKSVLSHSVAVFPTALTSMHFETLSQSSDL